MSIYDDIVTYNTERCKGCVFNPFNSKGSNDICTLMDVDDEYYHDIHVEWFCAYYESAKSNNQY